MDPSSLNENRLYPSRSPVFFLLKGILLVIALFSLGTLPCRAQQQQPIIDMETLNRLINDKATADAAFVTGKRISEFCSNCHGDKGVSVLPEVPNLAEQNIHYLFRQIELFVHGGRRNEFMEGLMKFLKPEERAGLAVYYNRMKAVPTGKTYPETDKLAKIRFVQLCQRCHGPHGRGDETIPRIAGQHYEYIALTLHRYRDKTGERLNAEMTNNTHWLTDKDIEALARYLASMK
ncbi:MAG: c-type cytochrome [Betaproteobacteria bacterium]|nr:c-type cytochrome [Betaproteobacteria bacterium]